MLISKRQIVIGATAATLFPSATVFGQERRDFFGQSVGIKGTLPTDPKDTALVPEVLALIPKGDYMATMLALARLDKNPKAPSNSVGEPWNRRWAKHANPLLVRIWHDMGYIITNDCTAWCAVTLSWCLERGGITPPKHRESSQAFLKFGTPVTTPQRGDICVFTNYGDADHGHVTIFEAMTAGHKSLQVVGANQDISSSVTNCPGNLGTNAIDERPMALKTSGHFLNRYVRP
ncbi:CHAP domain-containing protein [Sphingosinicellaceae bacterium]|nr:CHAP domain-containing protein [Sphingosinicellaceae bacterium]